MLGLPRRSSAPLPPLTHHEMLAVIAPIARRGRHVDLRESDRHARRIVFEAVDRDVETPLGERVAETLVLEDAGDDTLRLERRATLAGITAKLTTAGRDVDRMLGDLDAVPVETQFSAGPGFAMASSYRFYRSRRVLTEACMKLDRLTLTMNVPALEGVAARISLHADRERLERLALPEDLLAVLGWDWSSLERDGNTWRARVRLRGTVVERSADAERKLALAASHLGRTLAEPPLRFHQRLERARWLVAARQALPLAAAASLAVDAGLLPLLELASHSILPLAVLAVPPTLLVLFLTKTENPRFALPALPTPETAGSW